SRWRRRNFTVPSSVAPLVFPIGRSALLAFPRAAPHAALVAPQLACVLLDRDVGEAVHGERAAEVAGQDQALLARGVAEADQLEAHPVRQLANPAQLAGVVLRRPHRAGPAPRAARAPD